MILGQLSDERDFEDLITDIWLGAQTESDVAASFEQLGQALAQARADYQQAHEYDEALFGEDFSAE